MDDIWNEAQQDKIRALEEGRFWLQTSAKVPILSCVLLL